MSWNKIELKKKKCDSPKINMLYVTPLIIGLLMVWQSHDYPTPLNSFWSKNEVRAIRYLDTTLTSYILIYVLTRTVKGVTVCRLNSVHEVTAVSVWLFVLIQLIYVPWRDTREAFLVKVTCTCDVMMNGKIASTKLSKNYVHASCNFAGDFNQIERKQLYMKR